MNLSICTNSYPVYAAVRGGYDPHGHTGPEIIDESTLRDDLEAAKHWAAVVDRVMPDLVAAHPVVRYVKIDLVTVV